MQIRSVDRDIRELLAANFYKIPRFQRPYSWDRENIEEFWNDTAGDNRPAQDYFIGSMVVYSDRDSVINIVDGQQRLTTVTIALSALRDVFQEEGFTALALGAQSLIEKTTINNEKRFVLSTESSYPFFQNRILGFGERQNLRVDVGPEEENIQMAYNTLAANIRSVISATKTNTELSPEKKRETIEQLLLSIRDKILSLKLILIELHDEDDAYVIFETLNTRGKDLSVSDLLRNFFTRHLRPANREADTAKIQWQNVLRIINESSVDLVVDVFLHHQWLSRRRFITLRELFRSIKNEIQGNEIQEYLTELVNDSSLYRQIHETSFVDWTPQERDIEKGLRALQLFRVRQQTPFVLTLFREYRRGNIRIPQVTPAIQSLESFHFLFNAVTQQRSSGGISKMFVSSAIQLDRAPDLQRKQIVIRELMAKLRERTPSYDEFRINFRQVLYTNTISKNRALVRYILSRFDEHARPAVTVDYNGMTIEHLYSQSDLNEIMNESVVGMIGNLILIAPELNVRLANRPFAEKLQILRETNYPLGPTLRDAVTFGREEIEHRTDYLAEEAFNRVWSV